MAYDKEYQAQEGWFNLFANQLKDKDNQPDFTGEGLYKGKPSKGAMWKKKTIKGDRYVSVHIEDLPEEPKPVSTQEALDDDIPF